MENLSNDHKDRSNQHENSHKLCDETRFPNGKSTETEKTRWSEFPNGGEAIVEQILASEERNKSKRAGLQE